MPDREKGTVEWFNEEKGIGYIKRENGEDVFVHHRQIQAKGFRTLSEGQRVEFEVFKGEKSLEAGNVTVLKTPLGGTIASLVKEEERGVIKSDDGQMFSFDYSTVWEDIDTLSIGQRVTFKVFQGETTSEAEDVVTEAPIPNKNQQREKGTLTSLNKETGTGYIKRENGKEDVYVHRSEISDSTWLKGQPVEFEVEEDEENLLGRAVKVQVLKETGYLSPFDSKKRYGLIMRDGEGDIFFHFTDIQAENPSTLSPTRGHKVKYEVRQTPKGLAAKKIEFLPMDLKEEAGTLKCFDEKAGYGFIVRSNGEGDIFFHANAIHDGNPSTWPEGQVVKFEVSPTTSKGPIAVEVEVLDTQKNTEDPSTSSGRQKAEDAVVPGENGPEVGDAMELQDEQGPLETPAPNTSQQLSEGIVTHIGPDKRFGCIERLNDSKQFFVYTDQIQRDGNLRLQKNQLVRFRPSEDEQGPRAEDVTPLETPAPNISQQTQDEQDPVSEDVTPLETPAPNISQQTQDEQDPVSEDVTPLETPVPNNSQKIQDEKELNKTKKELNKTKKELNKTKKELNKTKKELEKEVKEMRKMKKELEKEMKEMKEMKEEFYDLLLLQVIETTTDLTSQERHNLTKEIQDEETSTQGHYENLINAQEKANESQYQLEEAKAALNQTSQRPSIFQRLLPSYKKELYAERETKRRDVNRAERQNQIDRNQVDRSEKKLEQQEQRLSLLRNQQDESQERYRSIVPLLSSMAHSISKTRRN